MRNRHPGKIRDGLWYLGHKETGVYLLEGADESIVISGGMSYIVPTLLEQMDRFGINKEKIRKLLILHSHFDHVGIVPYLKKSLPSLEIFASARAWELLAMPKAIHTINMFGRSVAERMGTMDVYATYELDWYEGLVGSPVHEGDKIDLGEVTLVIFETPGHSSCSITAYVPLFKALFPSDGGGIPFRGTILASGNSNFTQYQQSLEKLRKLPVEIYCADHYGYITGNEAAEFIGQSIISAQKERQRAEKTYLETGDIDKTVTKMVDNFYDEYTDYFLSREIFKGVQRQMIRHIAGALEASEPKP